jgi:hypothetical protein
MHNDFASVLGMRLDDLAESGLLRSSNEPPKTELIEDRFHMEVPASGIAFIADLDGRVTTIQFHAEGHQGYKGFVGELPEGISFADDRQTIHSRLGRPSASGGGTVIHFLGKVPMWDRFDTPSHSLHVQYVAGEGAVNLVSLMRPDAVPK